jgi:regulator of replication initiation timing
MTEDISTRRYVRQGSEVLLKEDVQPKKLSDRDIIHFVNDFENKIKQAETAIEEAKKNIASMEEQNVMIAKDLKGLRSHHKWAKELQESKMKALIDKVLPIHKEVIDANYDVKDDPGLSPEQNTEVHKYSKFRRLQDAIGRDKEVAESIHPTIISEMVYTDCVIDNPWA